MNDARPQIDLQSVAKQVMLAHGFQPDFPPAVQQQLASLQSQPPQLAPGGDLRDLRALLWSSIDNDTSKDLDQIEVAEPLTNGDVKVLVGIADVDGDVPKGSAIDQHAATQATTVYTGIRNFSMLPEALSTGITSLLENQDNAALVIEFVVTGDGHVKSSDLYRAVVRNKAQLTYNSIGPWLQGEAPASPKVAASSDLQAQLKLQNDVAKALKQQRYQHGALNIETIEVRPVLVNDKVADVVKQEKNAATDLIEDFMIAANEVVARALANVSSIRRVVKTPERWDRIVQLAAEQESKWLLRRRTGRHREKLHPERGCCSQGGTRDDQTHLSLGHEWAHWRRVRCNRDRSQREGNFCARVAAPCGRHAGARPARPRCGRQFKGQTGENRCSTRLYRFRARLGYRWSVPSPRGDPRQRCFSSKSCHRSYKESKAFRASSSS